jgi:hypothetical protein
VQFGTVTTGEGFLAELDRTPFGRRVTEEFGALLLAAGLLGAGPMTSGAAAAIEDRVETDPVFAAEAQAIVEGINRDFGLALAYSILSPFNVGPFLDDFWRCLRKDPKKAAAALGLASTPYVWGAAFVIRTALMNSAEDASERRHFEAYAMQDGLAVIVSLYFRFVPQANDLLDACLGRGDIWDPAARMSRDVAMISGPIVLAANAAVAVLQLPMQVYTASRR